MTQNYILEDSINFWDMLNDDDGDDNNDNVCFLTKVPLTKNHIILECGHKFNYFALIEEVKQQKTRKVYSNPYNFSYCNQFYCPYCRTIIKGVLPYIPHEFEEKIKYVNYPASSSIKHHNCCYTYLSGKNKGQQCSSFSAFESDIGTYCLKHYGMSKNKYSKSIQNNEIIQNNKSIQNNEIEFSNRHTVKEIKELLKQLNLPVSGNKKTLVERLFLSKNKL